MEKKKITIIKRTTWGRKMEGYLPERIVLVKEEPNNLWPDKVYNTHIQVCPVNKTKKECEEMPTDQMLLTNGNLWMDYETALVNYKSRIINEKQYQNMKSIRSID
jgi:hypothetical protein